MYLKIMSLLFICLFITSCNKDDKNEVAIEVYTGALGDANGFFPDDLIKLWQPIEVNGTKKIPVITIKRIDLADPVSFNLTTNSQADAETNLNQQKTNLEVSKIGEEFSYNKTSNFQAINANINQNKDVFYFNSPFDGHDNYQNIDDLLKALKGKIEHDQRNKPKYVIVYNLIDVDYELKKLDKSLQTTYQQLNQDINASNQRIVNNAQLVETVQKLAPCGLANNIKSDFETLQALIKNSSVLAQNANQQFTSISDSAKAAKDSKNKTQAFLTQIKSIDESGKALENAKIQMETQAGKAETLAEQLKQFVTKTKSCVLKPKTVNKKAKSSLTEDEEFEDEYENDELSGIKKEIRRFQNKIRRNYY